MANPIVTITMENGDVMKAELYPEIAPNTVNNFISLVKKGFYDGLIFHRVINGFMIQGGCPDGTGMGGPGYSIKGEFNQNRFQNDLRHTEGVLSMARAMHPNSAGSQFFIMHKAAPHLDGAYEGMDVVNRMPRKTRIIRIVLWMSRKSNPLPWRPLGWIIRNRRSAKALKRKKKDIPEVFPGYLFCFENYYANVPAEMSAVPIHSVNSSIFAWIA